MEPDRYAANHKIYILGMICLILSLSFLFFSLYIVPFLIWELDYDVPLLVVNLISVLKENYNYSLGASKLIVWLLFFIPGLIAGFISYRTSNYIDNTIYHLNSTADENQDQKRVSEHRQELKDSSSLALKIIGLMILIVAAIFMLELLIQTTA